MSPEDETRLLARVLVDDRKVARGLPSEVSLEERIEATLIVRRILNVKIQHRLGIVP